MNTILKQKIEERQIYDVVSRLLNDGKITINNDTLVIPIHKDNNIVSYQYLNLIKPFKLFKKNAPSKGYFEIFNNEADNKLYVTESFTDMCSILKIDNNINVACVFSCGNIDVLKMKPFNKYQLLSFLDNDKAGRDTNKKLFGMKLKVSFVRWGLTKEKDVNEMLGAGKRRDIQKLMENSVASPHLAGIFNSGEVYRADIPAPIMIIPGLLPEGLTLLCGKPKRGKSFLCLNIANQVSIGGRVLGQFNIDSPIRVLYLGLEDTPRRIKGRLRKIIPNEDFTSDKVCFSNSWRKLGQGCEEDLTDFLTTYPDTKLIIIDTLEKIAPDAAQKSNGGLYSLDYGKITPLKEICDRYGVAIICVHHLNKREDDDITNLISGSTGLTGACDTLMILNREIRRADARLYITGRDIEESDFGLAFDSENALWSIAGETEDLELPPEKVKIMRVFRDNPLGVFSVNDVNEVLARGGVRKNENTLRNHIEELVATQKIGKVERGKYTCI